MNQVFDQDIPRKRNPKDQNVTATGIFQKFTSDIWTFSYGFMTHFNVLRRVYEIHILLRFGTVSVHLTLVRIYDYFHEGYLNPKSSFSLEISSFRTSTKATVDNDEGICVPITSFARDNRRLMSVFCFHHHAAF